MKDNTRPAATWFILIFLVISIVLLLSGQTLCLIDYDLTVSLGLQESVEQVGRHGVEVGRAFGAADTVVYIPLMIASFAGLWLRKGWSLLTTAAVGGISVYWSLTIGFSLWFLPGTPGYHFDPGAEIYLFVAAYAVFGIWVLAYLLARGDNLLR